jgi:Holliday junction DNA helicase RuvA
MIGRLRGRIESYAPDSVIIDVGGVGYHVFCSGKTLAALPREGEFAEVHTEMLVSQDMIRLVGFASEVEREWFRLLQTVQGVGTKVALSLLSTLTGSEIAQAIAFQDKAMLSRAPGVGRKVAERIVVELKDKVSALATSDPALVRLRGDVDTASLSAAADAVSALVNLGYAQVQAGASVSAALHRAGDKAATEVLIRLALKELAR